MIAEPTTARVVKRYANRKLYDTRDSKYVTLQQIAEYVRLGEEIRIVDNTTKEDLTRVTLAQIIYEEEKNPEARSRSVRSLRDFIQEGRELIQEGRELIHESRERFLSSLRDGPVGKLVGMHHDEAEASPASPSEEATPTEGQDDPHPAKRLSPKEAFDELQRLADDRVRSLVSAAVAHVGQLQAEVRRLQSRIEELEAKLVGAARRKTPAEPADPATPSDEDAPRP